MEGGGWPWLRGEGGAIGKRDTWRERMGEREIIIYEEVIDMIFFN